MNDNKDNITTQADDSEATVEQATTKTSSPKKSNLCNSILGKVVLFIILAIFCIGEIAVLVLIFALFLSFYVAIIIAGAIGISTVFIIKAIKERKAKKSATSEISDEVPTTENSESTNNN
jgi:uncharacterized membrane protein